MRNFYKQVYIAIKRLASFIYHLLDKAGQDDIGHYSGGIAYRTIMSVPALLTLLLLLITTLAKSPWWKQADLLKLVRNTASPYLPKNALDELNRQLEHILSANYGVLTSGALALFVLALWNYAGAIRSALSGLRRIYGTNNDLRWYQSYFLPYLLFLPVAILAAGSLVMLNVLFIVSHDFSFLSLLLRLVPNAILLVIVEGFYYLARSPRREAWHPTWAPFATIIMWNAMGYFVQKILGLFGDAGAAWGALAGVIIVMLYLYWLGYLFLLGAEIDCHLQTKNQARRL